MNEFEDFYKETTWPYIKTKFYFSKNNPVIPINLKTLYEHEFKNIIEKRALIIRQGKSNIDNCMKDLETLIKEVEKEITTLKE